MRHFFTCCFVFVNLFFRVALSLCAVVLRRAFYASDLLRSWLSPRPVLPRVVTLMSTCGREMWQPCPQTSCGLAAVASAANSRVQNQRLPRDANRV